MVPIYIAYQYVKIYFPNLQKGLELSGTLLLVASTVNVFQYCVTGCQETHFLCHGHTKHTGISGLRTSITPSSASQTHYYTLFRFILFSDIVHV